MNTMWFRSPGLRRGALVGLLGGIALVAVPMLDLRGETIYVPYTILMVVLTALAALDRALERWQRFGLVLTGFMAASLVLYLYIILIDNPSALSISVLGHAWRLGFLVAIGAVLSAAAAFFTERPWHKSVRG